MDSSPPATWTNLFASSHTSSPVPQSSHNIFEHAAVKSDCTIAVPGTRGVELVPLKEPDVLLGRTGTQEYQSITFQQPFQNYSLEELRVADYMAGPAEFARGVVENTSFLEACRFTEREQDHVQTNGRQLYKGTGVEIFVGTSHDSWPLPLRLVCKYSSLLRRACESTCDTLHGNIRIYLPEEDPGVFELFVEWMFDGTWDLDFEPPTTLHPSVSLCAQAWFLGDRIQCLSFKNLAIDRLYTAHASESDHKPFTTLDVDYAFTHSAPDSKLCLFYKHLLAKYFSVPNRAEGSPADWYTVLQKHMGLGVFVMEAMRTGPEKEGIVRPYMDYRDVESSESEEVGRGVAITVSSARQDGESVGVKKEPVQS